MEKCEERLDNIKYDKKDKVGKLEEFQKIFHQSRKVHQRNSQALNELQSSGFFSILYIFNDANYILGCEGRSAGFAVLLIIILCIIDTHCE